MKLNLIILIIILIFFRNLFSIDYEMFQSIEWGSTELPPIHNIPNGEFKNLGCSDILIKLFNKEFRVTKSPKLFPSKRLFFHLEKSEALANPFLKKTKIRSNFLYYSDLPTAFVPTLVLIVTADIYNSLENKVMSLENILANKNNKIGLQVIRSYGNILDPIIDKHKNSTNIYYEFTENPYKKLLNKLKHGKLDFLIGFPMEIEFLKQDLNLTEFRYIKIEELKEQTYTVSYFGISKTELGKKIIDEVNKILPELRKQKNYRQNFERWIGKDQLKQYRTDYDKIFLQNKIN